jgi:hypothetical protein
MKYLLYLFELAVALILVLCAFLFGWAMAFTVNKETGNLPKFLRWFQTVDATCYDTMWVHEHPTWSKWKIACTWIMRNPAYGFCAWVAPKGLYGEAATGEVKIRGDVDIADGEFGKAGWFLVTSEGGWFNFSYVLDLKNGKCMRGEMGWYLLPLAKGYSSVNTGLLQTSPFRFYEFGVKGN